MEYEKITINNKVFYLVPEKDKLKIKKYAITSDNELKQKLTEYINELRTTNVKRLTFTTLQDNFNTKYNYNVSQVNMSALLDDLEIKKIRPKNIKTLLL